MLQPNTNNRIQLKEEETRILFEVYKNDKSLFERPFFVEDAKTLDNFGIYIPDKEHFPTAVVKFLPQDFIVEEVSESGEIETVEKSNVLNQDTVIENAPTVYATLVKCGLSTLNAIDELSKILSCSPDQIKYAGLKDKDAVTAQKISLRGVSAEKLKSINSPHFFLKNVIVGKGVMEKGKLKGNQFTILLRTGTDFVESGGAKVFIEQLSKVKDFGFYNYFYLQRFGTPRLAAHYWGMDIVHGYYRKVIESFISYSSVLEIPYFRNLRKELGTMFGQWGEMLKKLEMFPLIFQNELKAVRYLEKNPEDFLGALIQIQDQTSMWVAAFSSWFYNQKIASYVKLGKEIPEKLPLFLDPNGSSLVYKDLMEHYRISLNDFRGLKQLPFIQTPKKPVSTRELVKIDNAEIVDEGVILKFFLPKGEYATTFLSHLFNLISDRPNIAINENSIDTKKMLSEKDISETLEFFKPIIHPKSKNYFEELLIESKK